HDPKATFAGNGERWVHPLHPTRTAKRMISPIQKTMPSPIHFQASELFCRYPLVPRDQAISAIIGQPTPTTGRIKKAASPGHDNGWLASSASRSRLVSTEYAIDASMGLRFLATSSLRAASIASGK